jgi:DNA repair protein RecN (Recombination protein N)
LRALAEQLAGALQRHRRVPTELGDYLTELPSDASFGGQAGTAGRAAHADPQYAADIDGVLQWGYEREARRNSTSPGGARELGAASTNRRPAVSAATNSPRRGQARKASRRQ